MRLEQPLCAQGVFTPGAMLRPRGIWGKVSQRSRVSLMTGVVRDKVEGGEGVVKAIALAGPGLDNSCDDRSGKVLCFKNISIKPGGVFISSFLVNLS